MNVLRLLAPLTVFLAVSVTATSASSPADQKSTGEETKTLDQLYAEALAEGGNLLVYHGGDTANQQDGVQAAFRAAYPKINFTMIIDYSKYHDVRVDNQIKTNSLEADIIAVQTLQNYPRWKKQGDLLCYKPAGFSQIYQPFVDKDGCWLAHAAYSFSYFYDTAQLNASGLPIPKSAKDLGNPVYANHIVSSYPHDDDAALFIYHQYIEKYGWDWVAKMAAQNIQFKRGSNTPGEAVSAKQKAIGVAASGPWSVPTVVTVNGKDADSPYLVWGQRMAILKKAPHPAAAKLFLNWIVSKQTQSTTMFAMSSRVDTKSPAPWDFPQASTDKFPVFMEDRAAIERLKFTLALYFGEVQGVPSPGVYGLHPRK